MSPENFADLMSEIPQFEIGGEVFLSVDSGAVNVRHVVAIEHREGNLVLKYQPVNHTAKVRFLPGPGPEPEPGPEPIPAPEPGPTPEPGRPEEVLSP